MRILFLCNQWHVAQTPCRAVGRSSELRSGQHQWIRAVGAAEAMPGDISYDIRSDTFSDIMHRIPGGDPDVVVIWEPGYVGLPAGIEEAPCPLVACYSDWNLLMPAQAGMLEVYDYLFTDRPGIRILRAMGYQNAEFWPMWGHDPEFSRVIPGVAKAWDVGMIGNLNAVVQRERAPWLARVARLADRYRVRIAGGVYGEEYTRVLNATKITFNRSIRGEMNMRCYEAAACGSLLFCEEENEEIRDVFEDHRHCVLYNDRNLEELIEYYLREEGEREKITTAARERVGEYSFPRHLLRLADRLEQLDLKFRTSTQMARSISVPGRPPEVGDGKRRARQVAGTYTPGAREAALLALREALTADADDAAALNDAAVIQASLAGDDPDRNSHLISSSLQHLRRAAELRPSSAFYKLNLAHLHAATGRTEAAMDLAQQALLLLDSGQDDAEDPFCLSFPFGWDEFRVQYSGAYNATRSMPENFGLLRRCLLLRRGGMLLGRLAEQLGQTKMAILCFRVAVAARPDLGSSRIRLASALAVAGELNGAIAQLEAAMETDPLELEAWTLYTGLLLFLGRERRAREFVSDRLTILKGLGMSDTSADSAIPGQEMEQVGACLGYLLEVLSDTRAGDEPIPSGRLGTASLGAPQDALVRSDRRVIRECSRQLIQ